jgi:ribosome modulation factor
MSQRCATNWDQFCERDSQSIDPRIADNVAGLSTAQRLTAGEILIRDVAHQKYLVNMINGSRQMIPFDPISARSSMLSTWVSTRGLPMIPVYAINPATADGDVVLNKLLDKPGIAPDVLVGLYKSAKQSGLNAFDGTILGHWFAVNKQLLPQ